MADEQGGPNEFLIPIGFRTDPEGQRRYQEAISTIQRGAAALVTSLTGAAVATAAAVKQITTNLAGVAFEAQGLHATTAGVEALDRAFKELQGSAAAGHASFVAFTKQALDHSAGVKDFLAGEGVTLVEGHFEDAYLQIVDIYSRRIAADPAHRQYYQTQALGRYGIQPDQIDPANKATKLLETQREKLAKLGPEREKAAQDAKKLQQSITALGEAFNNLATSAAAPLFKPLTELFDWLQDWVQDHGEYLIGILERIWKQIEKTGHDLYVIFRPALIVVKGLWDDVVAVVKFLGVDISGLKGLHAVLAAITAAGILSGLASLGSALTLGFLPFSVLLGVLLSIIAALTALGYLAPSAAQGATLPGEGVGAGAGGARLPGGGGLGGRGAVGGTPGGGRASGITGSATPGWWTAERQQHAYDVLTKGGLSDKGARGLISRWVNVEAPGGPNSSNNIGGGHYGIGQWSRSRAGAVWGNPDFDAQLQLALRELNSTERPAGDRLRSAKTDLEGATGASMFERAEGYNAATGQDYFTGKTASGVGRIPLNGKTASVDTSRPSPLSDTSHLHERQGDEAERKYIEDYHKRQQSVTGNPLVPERHSSTKIDNHVNHNTEVNVAGGDGDDGTQWKPSGDPRHAVAFGRLVGASA